jgi:hypothetical protein
VAKAGLLPDFERAFQGSFVKSVKAFSARLLSFAFLFYELSDLREANQVGR